VDVTQTFGPHTVQISNQQFKTSLMIRGEGVLVQPIDSNRDEAREI
jgi:hypothetical protein